MPNPHSWLAAVALLLAALPGNAAAAEPVGEDMWFVPPVSDDRGSQIDTGTDCIALHRVRSTRIVTGKGIVYQMSGDRMLINRVRQGASLLNRNQLLITRTTGAMLCAGDIVHLAYSSPGMSAGSVALGRFELYYPAAHP